EQLPDAVRKVAHTHLARHGEIHKSTEDDEVFYDVRGMKNGKHVEMSLTAGGKILSMEQEMDLAKIPEAVQKILKEHADGSKIEKIVKQTEDDEITYEAEVNKGGRNFSFDFSSTGEFLRVAEEITVTRAPLPVQKRIQTELGKGKVDSISQVVEKGETTFAVEMIKGEKDYSLVISTNGDLQEMSLPLSETPLPVQQKIKERVGSGKVDEINKTTDDDEISYEVDFTRDGKSRFFSVSAEGDLLSEEEDVVLADVPAAARKTIQENLRGQKSESLTKRTEEGEVFYDVEFSGSNQKKSFIVSEAGKLQKDDE
ncbi:MAG: PepSY-like domain-containing protein, partial [Verrucomicrobiota bacterium]